MRHFHWKTAIFSVVIFLFPVFFYPVSGSMSNGITTYSYGFPSKWLSVHFQNQGGRLFGFELFGANITGFNVSILTGLLDLLIVYFILTAFVKVFWTNHFSKKFTGWREKRYYEKNGIVPPEEEVETGPIHVDYIISNYDEDKEKDDNHDKDSIVNDYNENNDHEKRNCPCDSSLEEDEVESNKTA